jgi:hypothetical protein
MSSTKSVVWIDDEPRRERTAKDLGAQFINARGKNLALIVEKLLKRTQRPRLIIIDHVLNNTETKNPLFQKGSTIAEAIKEQWPDVPVVGVTNADNVEKIDLRTKQTYDELFPFVQFGKYIDQIDALKKGFITVGKLRAKSAKDVVGLLKPPKEDVERLVDALPEDLKKSFRDKSVPSRLYAWVRRLLERPGFLYDSLWAATFIGLNETGFQKVRRHFEKANYVGVFSSTDDPRWWSSQLSKLLYKHSQPRSGEMSWHVGRRLPGVKKEHFSRCYYCDKDFPDTVAYLDAASEQQRPMHLECTVLHPSYKRELYFEDIRVMKGD